MSPLLFLVCRLAVTVATPLMIDAFNVHHTVLSLGNILPTRVAQIESTA
jgi:hypothetical protein